METVFQLTHSFIHPSHSDLNDIEQVVVDELQQPYGVLMDSKCATFLRLVHTMLHFGEYSAAYLFNNDAHDKKKLPIDTDACKNMSFDEIWKKLCGSYHGKPIRDWPSTGKERPVFVQKVVHLRYVLQSAVRVMDELLEIANGSLHQFLVNETQSSISEE